MRLNRSVTHGSSPHSRGTGQLLGLGGADQRFIPALAGNRYSDSLATASSAVHPRTRGEQVVQQLRKPRYTGSSPHSRGTDGVVSRCLPGRRFIPALAGNRHERQRSDATGAVHPRTRGEQVADRSLDAGNGGSSPHSRGTVADVDRVDGVQRFIPALAGNSSGRLGR